MMLKMLKRILILLLVAVVLGSAVLYQNYAEAKTTSLSAIDGHKSETHTSSNTDPINLTVVYREPKRLNSDGTQTVLSHNEIANTFDYIIYHAGFANKIDNYRNVGWDGQAMLYVVLSGMQGLGNFRSNVNRNDNCSLQDYPDTTFSSNNIMWDEGPGINIFCDLHNAIRTGGGFDHDLDSSTSDVVPTEDWFLHVPGECATNGSGESIGTLQLERARTSASNSIRTLDIPLMPCDRLVSSFSSGQEDEEPTYFYRPNPEKSEVREMFAARIKNLLLDYSQHSEFAGIFLDNVEFFGDKIINQAGGSLPQEYNSLDDFEADVLQMVSQIRDQVNTVAQTTALDGPQANVPCPDDNCGPIYPTPGNCESMQNMQVPEPLPPCEPLPFDTPTPTDDSSVVGAIPIWGNMIQEYETTEGWNPYSDILTGGMQESFALDWEGCPRPTNHIINQIEQARAWIGAGNHYLAVTQGSRWVTCTEGGPSYDARARFALGVYLLIAESGQSSFHLADTRGETTSGYDYGRYDLYNELSEYHINFGQGGALNLEGNIYTRSFASGCTVRVDLTTKTASICPERFTEFLYLPLVARLNASTAAPSHDSDKNDEKTTQQLQEVCSEWQEKYESAESDLMKLLSQLCKEPESASRLSELCSSLQKIEINDEWEEELVQILKEICQSVQPNNPPQSTPPSGYPPPATATPHSYP